MIYVTCKDIKPENKNTNNIGIVYVRQQQNLFTYNPIYKCIYIHVAHLFIMISHTVQRVLLTKEKFGELANFDNLPS